MKSNTIPRTYSVFYGTSYGSHAADGTAVQEGAAARAGFGRTALTETFEIVTPSDYEKLPISFDANSVIAALQTYFDDELESDVTIDRVLSVVYLGRLISPGAAETPSMTQLFLCKDYKTQWPLSVQMQA